jgi:hypothetical protein
MKHVVRLATLDYDKLRELPESGMGYYIVTGRLDSEPERTLVVAGDYIVPAAHPEFASIEDLWHRGPFPGQEVRGVSLTSVRTLSSSVSLPPGYVPTAGAVPLLGTITLAAPTAFYRLLMSPNDHRFANGKLAKQTYLTTDLDRLLVNTGFAAVGRYALPIPVPASHVVAYVFPVGTVLNVGTVQPNFGQAGGGVEVRTTAVASPTQSRPPKMPSY